MGSSSSGPRLAVAMDFTSVDAFRAALTKLEDLPVILKVGLRLLPWMPAAEIRELSERFPLFIDAKLHDIPTQVAEAAQVWDSLGARYLTVHLSGGESMLATTAKAVRRERLHIAGVSVLTSLKNSDMEDLGVGGDCSAQVVRLVKLGLRSGIRTFVCSVGELAALRQALGEDCDDAEFITPGLVSNASEAGHADQSRVFTIEDAVREGSDVLVVGRSIWKAVDPRRAAADILELL